MTTQNICNLLASLGKKQILHSIFNENWNSFILRNRCRLDCLTLFQKFDKNSILNLLHTSLMMESSLLLPKSSWLNLLLGLKYYTNFLSYCNNLPPFLGQFNAIYIPMVIYRHSTVITKVMLLYNTEWWYDHGRVVIYHGKRFCNIGPWFHSTMVKLKYFVW